MNPEKKARSILKNIEAGRANEANIISLVELLDKQPSIVSKVIGTLNGILQKSDIKAQNSAIFALNKLAEDYIGLADYSVDAIVGFMQKRKEDLREDDMLKILEILFKITQKYPERMGVAVPELLTSLENTSKKVREKAYFMLALLAITHYEFFRVHSKKMTRMLNGLNLDERTYTCRLIMKIAEKDRTIVADIYDVLEDLRLNHPDSNLRSEAAYAMDNLKETVRQRLSETKAQPVKATQKSGLVPLIKDEPRISDGFFSELADLMAPNEEDLKNVLDEMGFRHLIVNRDNVKK